MSFRSPVLRVALVFDTSSLEELLIYESLREAGAEVHPIQLAGQLITTQQQFDVAVNRTLSKHLREYVSESLEAQGVKVLHQNWLEILCGDKVRTKRIFEKAGIPVNRSILINRFLVERSVLGLSVSRSRIRKIGEVMGEKLGLPYIIKPTAGSRGVSIIQVPSAGELEKMCLEHFRIEHQSSSYPKRGQKDVPHAFYQNLINPHGTFGEEFAPHALDLRFVVRKLEGQRSEYIGCLARVGRGDHELAKNTALGSIPVGIVPPRGWVDISLNAARAVISSTDSAGSSKSFVVGVDIIPRCDDITERDKIYRAVKSVSAFKDKVIEQTKKRVALYIQRLSAKSNDMRRISADEKLLYARRELGAAYGQFALLDGYQKLQNSIVSYLENAHPKVDEINTRIDFAYNTLNLACPLLSSQIAEVIMGMK